jgi:hypothetical protein
LASTNEGGVASSFEGDWPLLVRGGWPQAVKEGTPKVQTTYMTYEKVKFMKILIMSRPTSTIHHFLVDIDSFDPMLVEEAAGLDPTMSIPESITQFLTLPTITVRVNPQTRLTDPVVDFTKSSILTSDGYLNAMQQL